MLLICITMKRLQTLSLKTFAHFTLVAIGLASLASCSLDESPVDESCSDGMCDEVLECFYAEEGYALGQRTQFLDICVFDEETKSARWLTTREYLDSGKKLCSIGENLFGDRAFLQGDQAVMGDLVCDGESGYWNHDGSKTCTFSGEEKEIGTFLENISPSRCGLNDAGEARWIETNEEDLNLCDVRDILDSVTIVTVDGNLRGHGAVLGDFVCDGRLDNGESSGQWLDIAYATGGYFGRPVGDN